MTHSEYRQDADRTQTGRGRDTVGTHSGCRQDADWTQLRHIHDVGRAQMGHIQDAGGTQSGCSQDTFETQLECIQAAGRTQTARRRVAFGMQPGRSRDEFVTQPGSIKVLLPYALLLCVPPTTRVSHYRVQSGVGGTAAPPPSLPAIRQRIINLLPSESSSQALGIAHWHLLHAGMCPPAAHTPGVPSHGLE